jgi:putative phosphoribosyl transferase
MRDHVSEPALIWTGKAMLEGRLAIPHECAAVAVFASAPSHPDGDRDEQLMAALFAMGVATVYAPLLTEDEIQFDARTAHFRHDTDLLGQRFIDITQWVRRSRDLSSLPLLYIGSSGAAAGAIAAAALRPDLVSAVIAIDGRTDLAVEHLRRLRTPTLLIVKDMPVLRMNREALTKIRGERRIEIVHGLDDAAVETVVEKAVQWVDHVKAQVPA